MELIDRFKYIMKLNNLSASAFADEIGVQRSSVSHILSGRNKPSLDFIRKVVDRYPKVDVAWLINGTTTSSDKTDSTDDNTEISETVNSKDSVIKKKIVENKNEADKEKKVVRVLLFYSDSTFEEFNSY